MFSIHGIHQHSLGKAVISLVRLISGKTGIGANYGVYALLMSQTIGAKGKLSAFEPALSTAGYLLKSIELNSVNNVTLLQAAVSDHAGKEKIAVNANAEFNSLQTSNGEQTETEEVELVTLDSCKQKRARSPEF